MNIVNLLAEAQKDFAEPISENKGALVGAVVGYLFSDNKKIQSAILGAVAGALILDKEKPKDE